MNTNKFIKLLKDRTASGFDNKTLPIQAMRLGGHAAREIVGIDIRTDHLGNETAVIIFIDGPLPKFQGVKNELRP